MSDPYSMPYPKVQSAQFADQAMQGAAQFADQAMQGAISDPDYA